MHSEDSTEIGSDTSIASVLDEFESPEMCASQGDARERIKAAETGSKPSYRDILARKMPPRPQKVISEEQLVPKAKWEPKLVIKQVPCIRIDRKYGPQPAYTDEDEGGLSIANFSIYLLQIKLRSCCQF